MSGMREARIGDATRHLVLRWESGPAGRDDLVVGLGVDGLTAATRVYGDGSHSLADFFAGLESDWRGWRGTRRWASLEGELSLAAQHTGSHVRLEVTISRASHDWWAGAEIVIEPGEQLSAIVREVAGVVRVEM